MSTDHKYVTISWSSLRVHEQCKQKAMLVRSGRKNPAQDIRVFFHGTVVDRVMRQWLENDPQPGQMPDMVQSILDAEERKAVEEGDGVVRWKSATDKATTAQWCRELVTRLEPILYQQVIPFEYQPARRFKVPVQVPWLDGSMTWINLAGETDLLVRGPEGKFRIWDLKGTNDDSYWRKTFGQLIFYDVALDAEFGVNAEFTGLIQPMCKEQVLRFDFTDAHRDEIWARIMRMAADIWSRDSAPKEDHKGCGYCQVRHACAKFAPVNPGGGAQRSGVSLVGGADLLTASAPL